MKTLICLVVLVVAGCAQGPVEPAPDSPTSIEGLVPLSPGTYTSSDYGIYRALAVTSESTTLVLREEWLGNVFDVPTCYIASKVDTTLVVSQGDTTFSVDQAVVCADGRASGRFSRIYFGQQVHPDGVSLITMDLSARGPNLVYRDR